MMIILPVCVALLFLAALVFTAFGSLRASSRLGYAGGACFMLALIGALVLGIEGKYLLLAALVLLCAAQIRRRSGHEL